MNVFSALTQLTDVALHGETKRLTGSANTVMAQLLAHLAEVEARGIHRERACSSLYTYCAYELRMSEDEAQRRCRAARLARQFPALLEMLAEASIHLTGILLIGPHLTQENQAELLARARFRTKRELERLVAEIAPCRDVPSVIEALHGAGAADSIASLDDATATGTLARRRNTWAAYVRSLAGPVRQIAAGLGAGQAPPRMSEQESAVYQGSAIDERPESESESESETGARTPARDVWPGSRQAGTADKSARSNSEPSWPGPRYRVQFTADQAYVDLLEEARNLLQHELPGRELAEVQRRALELLVHKLRQRKYAATEPPRASAPTATTRRRQPAQRSATCSQQPQQSASSQQAQESAARSGNQKSAARSRHIPAEVRRNVWQRDDARCTYLDSRGQRCREQSGLEFHHQHPHGRGGPPSFENIRLRCRSHNDLAAEQDFGRDFIRERRAAQRFRRIRASAAP
jgi:5-methylcytosine-specific restriction endonuclease McrA